MQRFEAYHTYIPSMTHTHTHKHQGFSLLVSIAQGAGLPFGISSDLTEVYLRGNGLLGEYNIHAVNVTSGARRVLFNFGQLEERWSYGQPIATAYDVVMAGFTREKLVVVFDRASGEVLNETEAQFIEYEKNEGECVLRKMKVSVS